MTGLAFVPLRVSRDPATTACPTVLDFGDLRGPSAEAYAERMAPLLVSPDLEGHSGAMFNRKAFAILPSPGLTGGYVHDFMAASEALVSRANVSIPS